MKNYSLILVVVISLFFVACNKDEDIILDKPEDVTPYELDYSVVEYMPAPGQYINENISGFDNITSMSQACRQAEVRLKSQDYVSLGAWGGYIVVKFDSPILHNKQYNFAIAGNSFDTSNEPGIVWVMEDTNGNGIPDDVWYELRGSYYAQEGYERNYSVTYFRPEAGGDTYWQAGNGLEGYVNWNGTYHNQDYYYPNWVETDSYTLSGSKLPSHAHQNPNTGIWENTAYEWGYADNYGQDIGSIECNGRSLEVNRFKLADAIDSNGNPVLLQSILFVKVQTAIMGEASILGENSTEVCGFFPL